jgi:hypothetical protein
MDLWLHSIIPLSTALAEALVAATWQGLLLAASIALCLRLLPGLSPARRSMLWMAAFLVVVLLHLAPLVGTHVFGSHVFGSHVWGPHVWGPREPGALRIGPGWALGVAALWCMLAFYRAIRLACGLGHLHRIARRATPAATSCAALPGEGWRRAELCTSLDVDRPNVLGFWSPRILLPPALLAQLSAADLEQIVLHELEHLRRADDWTNLLQKLVLVLFPLNPVLPWIERRLCAERELACDDGVLRKTHAGKAYARCLARLAEHSLHSPHALVRQGASLALGAWQRQSELARRVYRILQTPDAGRGSRRAGWVTAALAVALVAGAGELASSPSLVRFAPPVGARARAVPAGLAPAGFVKADLAQADFARTGFDGPAHLTLAKAIMPATASFNRLASRPVSHPVARHLAPVRRTGSALSTARARDRVQAQSQPQRRPVDAQPRWVVLATVFATGLGSSLDGRPELIQQQVAWPSYAAVPVGDSWLIVQL